MANTYISLHPAIAVVAQDPREFYPFTERLPISLRLEFTDERTIEMHGMNIYDFFDDEGQPGEYAYLGPCAETGVELLLDGQPLITGQVVPEIAEMLRQSPRPEAATAGPNG